MIEDICQFKFPLRIERYTFDQILLFNLQLWSWLCEAFAFASAAIPLALPTESCLIAP